MWPKSIDELNQTVRSAIVNHRLSFFAPLLTNKLTYLITAFESLYLKGVEKQEFTFKLAQKAGSVIGPHIKNEQDKVFKFIKLCYDLRSKIVHGAILSNLRYLNKESKKDKYFNSRTFYDLWVTLEKFLRISIQFFHRNSYLLTKEGKDIYLNPFSFEKAVNDFYSQNSIILGD